MNLQFTAPFASVTVDCAIFGFQEGRLKVLLIKRSSDPEAGRWALPGGFMDKTETLEEAASRILEQLTGAQNLFMKQFHVFSTVSRHPIDRVLTVGFYALVNPSTFAIKASWHAEEVYWCEIDRLPALAFDHAQIFEAARAVLKRDARIRPVGFELLSEKFTLKDLQDLYEAILDRKLDRRNFRRKIKALGILQELEEVRKGAHKDASLYKFDKQAYDQLSEDGFGLIL